jgi:hypothetical protein
MWLSLALAGVPALSGCFPPQASYSFGVSTSEVVGQFDVDDPASAGAPLILVYKYHYSFVEMEPGKVLTRPTASLAAVRPDGSFTISVPTDVVSLEIFFISPDRLTDLFQFQKQVGIGRIVYRAKLPVMRDWRSHFYTYLMPELEHVIVEARYQLPLQDQAQLSTWITAQRKRLEAQRKTPPAES